MARLGALQKKANMTVAADNSTVVAGLPKAAAASGLPLSVVVECDTGRKRAGVETPAEAIALAREISGLEGLKFAGFMMYPTETGWDDAQKFYDEALARARRIPGVEHAAVVVGTPFQSSNSIALRTPGRDLCRLIDRVRGEIHAPGLFSHRRKRDDCSL